MANTILFGEGYAYCDTYGRRALYSWKKHNFGLTEDLIPGQLDPSANEPPIAYPYGMANTFMFQVKPLPLDHKKCPPGKDCCDNWRAQTGHEAMNVAFADGSVRSIRGTISQQTWNFLLLPRDGQPPSNDY